MCSAQSKTLIFISLFLFATFNYCFALENNDAVSENGTALPVAEIFVSQSIEISKIMEKIVYSI